MIVIAPMAKSPPYLANWVFNDINTRLSVDCIINGAIPKPTIDIIIFLSNFKFFFLILRILLFPNRNFNTQAAETAWAVNVARAAPFTPKLSLNIKIGSNTIFISAPMATVIIPILAKPCVFI